MRFVSPCLSVKLGAVSSLALIVGSVSLSASLPPTGGLYQFMAVAGLFGLALGAFAAGRYWGQVQTGGGVDKGTKPDSHLISPQALMKFDAQGELTSCNKAGQTLLAAKTFELENDGLKNRIHVQDRPEFLTKLSMAAHGAKPTSAVVRLLTGEQNSQNRHRYTLVSFHFSPDEQDHAIAIVGLSETDGQVQNELLHDLHNAHEIMDAAKQAKSNFLNSISHELRTPLNAIIGFSDLLNADINGELNKAQRDYVSHIHDSGTHLLGIVNTLLEMSRIDAGHAQLELDTIMPDEVIGGVMAMLAPLAGEKNITLVPDLPAALPLLIADQRACTQIIINLVNNAIKFSHAGARVTVRARRVRDTLQLEIIDTGIGIGKDGLAKLGTPFYQADNGISRTYEGTGLGLSIVKGLIELHQGTISFASVPGEGTQVNVSLPLDGPKEILVGQGAEKSAPVSTDKPIAARGSENQPDSQLRHARG